VSFSNSFASPLWTTRVFHFRGFTGTETVPDLWLTPSLTVSVAWNEQGALSETTGLVWPSCLSFVPGGQSLPSAYVHS
jgi:hypothetical protein